MKDSKKQIPQIRSAPRGGHRVPPPRSITGFLWIFLIIFFVIMAGIVLSPNPFNGEPSSAFLGLKSLASSIEPLEFQCGD